jgi:tetratricopeptide (TPR) repeat protein
MTLLRRFPSLWVVLVCLFAGRGFGAESVGAPPTPAPSAVSTNDPVEVSYQKLLVDDDQAHEEIDQWIKDSAEFEKAGASPSKANLKARIEQRLALVDKAYKDFLDLHPKHARAHLAYGSFLHDLSDEDGGVDHWEKSRELDPSNPAVWNNLANYYGHRSPVTNAFVYYAKAIDLNPKEAVYVWNLATTVYLFRVDAMSFYGLDETGVFDKSLDLYRKAVSLDPSNFILVTDYANSFYGTKPPRYEEGIVAWNDALKVAGDDIEREGVRIHLARCKLNLKRFDEASAELSLVTNEMYASLKKRLGERIAEGRTAATTTNAPAAQAIEARK